MTETEIKNLEIFLTIWHCLDIQMYDPHTCLIDLGADYFGYCIVSCIDESYQQVTDS